MNFKRQQFSMIRAFTLLELLIAVAIFAIVLAAINAVFFTALHLRNSAAAALDAALPIEQGVAIIKRDLANIVTPGGTLAGPLQTTVMSNSIPGQISPDFYTASGIIDDTAPWGDIQKVSYVLVNSTNGAPRNLVRAVTRNLLATTTEMPPQQLLLNGVENVLFSYYDGSQWQAAWDSTQTTNLPLAIKVQIQLASQTLVPPQNEIALVVPLAGGSL